MLGTLLQTLHLWLVRCVIEKASSEPETYVYIIVTEKQGTAHRVALESVHKARAARKAGAYRKISITSNTIEPTSENEVLFACRVAHPKDT